MNFFDLINQAKAAFPKQDSGPLLNPQGPTPTPSPSPTPAPVTYYRNPQMMQFKAQNPKDYEQITSGSKIASHGNPLVEAIMNDLAVAESGLRLNPPNNPLWKGIPQQGPRGPWQITGQTMKAFGLEDPTNATSAAYAVNQALLNTELSRWLETVHGGGATKYPLKDLYTKEELNSFLSPAYQL